MLGAVEGDIIGSPYEWNNTDDRFFDLCHTVRGWSGGREVNFHPHYTDDTVKPFLQSIHLEPMTVMERVIFTYYRNKILWIHLPKVP